MSFEVCESELGVENTALQCWRDMAGLSGSLTQSQGRGKSEVGFWLSWKACATFIAFQKLLPHGPPS